MGGASFSTVSSVRGILRTIFVMPMMATPVAIALVWTMMFHPQLGVPELPALARSASPFAWVYDPATVIPTLGAGRGVALDAARHA
jgi:ABC-type sugar transport system permease subunit